MRRLTALFGIVFAGAVGLACRSEPPAPAPAQARRPAPPPVETELRGRLAETPDPALLDSARALLAGGGRQENCGPYRLYTDATDERLIAACRRPAELLDEIYAARYGIRPRGEPAAAIVLFADARSYRAFAREGGVPLGYAGYALAARGLAVFHATGSDSRRASGATALDSFVNTLVHELTHLVNRRALGVNLPPWLAEGLADGIGDTATPEGFDPLDGIVGLGPLARRLKGARESGKAGNLERLVSLKRGEFDRGTVSYDYEHSALLVRFLLAEPELASGFRKFLSDFAGGEPYHPDRLVTALGTSWSGLENRFTPWLVEQTGGG